MKLVSWMAGASVLSWLVAAALGSPGREVLFGMLGPLLVASGSWVVAERTYRRKRERLTAVLIRAFAAKMVFFGAYVALVLTLLSLRPVPFVVSFTSYFIALHLVEAFGVQRLFAENIRESR